MAPRLQLLSRISVTRLSSIAGSSYQPLAPFLYPILHQHRNASILNSLSDNKGAYNKKIRRGRGPSSGKGKTSGRGHKGQRQHGKVPAGFNGGQTPDEVVHGKRGFENHFSVDMAPINLNRIQYWINSGRLDPSKPITMKELNQSRCIHGVKDGVKVLARGKEELSTPIHLIVSRASAEAINTVEKLGGTVTTRYYTPFAIKKILKGEMDPIHSIQSQIELPEGIEQVPETAKGQEWRRWRYRLPDPARRKDIEYYRDEAHRGYLTHLVKEGQGPSLYFKTPGLSKKEVKSQQGKIVKGSENRLW